VYGYVHLEGRDSERGSSGAGGVQWADVKGRGDGRGDVVLGLPIHWCRGETLARQGEGRYSVRLGALGRSDACATRGTGRGGLDVCEPQRVIVGDKTWHLTNQRQPLAVWGVPADKGTLVRVRGLWQKAFKER
jgi:hypothetical protein